jgi:hypothetical protein
LLGFELLEALHFFLVALFLLLNQFLVVDDLVEGFLVFEERNLV